MKAAGAALMLTGLLRSLGDLLKSPKVQVNVGFLAEIFADLIISKEIKGY